MIVKHDLAKKRAEMNGKAGKGKRRYQRECKEKVESMKMIC